MTAGFDSVCRKKKMEEEEAEVKRKATDAAYQGKLEMSFLTPCQSRDMYVHKNIWEYLSLIKISLGGIL